MGDSANGKKLFMKFCATCHTIESGGKNKIGPNLFGVMGRAAASSPNFSYSAALKSKGITWDENNMNEYLAAPKKFVPGSKMVFAGIKNEKDRKDVVAYLRSVK